MIQEDLADPIGISILNHLATPENSGVASFCSPFSGRKLKQPLMGTDEH